MAITICTSLILWLPVLGAGEEASREDKLTQVMKDMRLAYKSLRQAVKEEQWDRMGEDAKKIADFSDKLSPLAPEKDPDPYKEELKKFTDVLHALDSDVRSHSLEDVKGNFVRVTQSCKACHKHYRNPFARMMDNIFLF